MANALYPKFLEKLWKAEIDTDVDTFRVALVTSSYTYSDTHEFFSSITNVLGVADLTVTSITNGILDLADVDVTGLSAGDPNAAIVYKWTGAAGTSPVMLYFDEGSGFDQDPQGGVRIIWPNDVNARVFPLGGLA